MHRSQELVPCGINLHRGRAHKRTRVEPVKFCRRGLDMQAIKGSYRQAVNLLPPLHLRYLTDNDRLFLHSSANER